MDFPIGKQNFLSKSHVSYGFLFLALNQEKCIDSFGLKRENTEGNCHKLLTEDTIKDSLFARGFLD